MAKLFGGGTQSSAPSPATGDTSGSDTEDFVGTSDEGAFEDDDDPEEDSAVEDEDKGEEGKVEVEENSDADSSDADSSPTPVTGGRRGRRRGAARNGR